MRLTLLSFGLLGLLGCAPGAPANRAPARAASSRAAPMAHAAGVEAGAEGALSLSLSRFPDGTAHSLADDRGSVILLDVWATWCEPCVVSLPVYASLAATYAERGLKVYALSLDEDPRQVARFVEETRITLPIFLDDREQLAARALRVNGVPTSYLIDRQGRVRFVHQGYEPRAMPRYIEEIEQLLSEGT